MFRPDFTIKTIQALAIELPLRGRIQRYLVLHYPLKKVIKKNPKNT
jgi:hypothetical protein